MHHLQGSAHGALPICSWHPSPKRFSRDTCQSQHGPNVCVPVPLSQRLRSITCPADVLAFAILHTLLTVTAVSTDATHT